jgi:hypothetical protein
MAVYLIVINVIQILLRFLVAVQVFRLAQTKKMNNFYWLAGHFFFMTLTDATILLFNGLNFGSVFNNPTLATALGFITRKGFYSLGDICLVFFVAQTFYQNRKSPFALFLGLSIAWGVGILGLYFLPKPPVLIPSDFVTFLWMAVVSYQAYALVARDRNVEDWIKARYLLIIVGSVLMCSGSADNIFKLLTTGKFGALSLTANIGLISGVVLTFLAWVMPEAFRVFLNRNYKPQNLGSLDFANLSEAEILEKIGKAV